MIGDVEPSAQGNDSMVVDLTADGADDIASCLGVTGRNAVDVPDAGSLIAWFLG